MSDGSTSGRDGGAGMAERPEVRFRATRPASRARKAVAFLLGGAVWAAAGVIAVVLPAVVLPGGSHIVRHLLLVTGVSWLVFGAALAPEAPLGPVATLPPAALRATTAV
ncbi:hypothetical protein [Streptomyces globisporus]|uniref:hypothetical protein n=1 Tax=Streptomyces globisporus TaxID=1908 RepID=UPI0019818EDD|nr:hypothetical protein [Streptomyces globisporus]